MDLAELNKLNQAALDTDRNARYVERIVTEAAQIRTAENPKSFTDAYRAAIKYELDYYNSNKGVATRLTQLIEAQLNKLAPDILRAIEMQLASEARQLRTEAALKRALINASIIQPKVAAA